MSFQGLQAKYSRLYSESAAWRLLRADNSPYILAFLESLFAEDNEVPYSRAKIMLEAEIEQSRDLGIWVTETPAITYINQWIKNGWLREMDNALTKTDASELALRFSNGLEDRGAGTTASHLRIVQEAVRDLAVAISPNTQEKIRLLEAKKAEIEHEINNLQNGVVNRLSPNEQKERIREIYQLASILTGDFRKVEDDIRLLDKDLRVQIIQHGASRGEVLLSLMEKESLLFTTEAGSAFESFFNLLCDQNRTTEFREQLRNILRQPAARRITANQYKFLAQLMRELSRESERVFRIRRRTEEGLRFFIESGAAAEDHAVSQLLSQLEKVAVLLREKDINLNQSMHISLPTGTIEIKSPTTMALRMPEDGLDTGQVIEQTNTRQLGADVLQILDTVQIGQIAAQIKDVLLDKGSLTIANIVNELPIKSGLEELVAFLRIASAVGAKTIGYKEELIISDKSGSLLSVSIPGYELSAAMFPADVADLIV